MNKVGFRNWRDVREEVLRRIHSREWPPGQLIPNETHLAEEFGCARATVNRALRAVAEAGLIDRKRKAGTRVAKQPTAKATLKIAVIRQDIEERGMKYGYSLLNCELRRPDSTIRAVLRTHADDDVLQLSALHLADDQPYALEERWINLRSAPDANAETFVEISANEWLLANIPFTSGEIGFFATNASRTDAESLGCEPGTALFALDRLTFDGDKVVTKVRITFAPGYRLRAEI
ncbi:MAG: UTRA domain-containing protein [Boseongicola sp.]|nr:MAG: UTRA domain-containing protein [Boseongicola sp.]